ncbi:MAG: hypothetical protein KF830_01465 [Planctomycetes bacterium]|nr:hypothetical protein [Planctomycetota bacterium]
MEQAGPGPTNHSEGFRAALAQWRLSLRTEVKKASSLPTAMFDACDPMLETRLADSAEAMLACLQQPADHLRDRSPAAELRLETVTLAELAALPRHVAAVDVGPLDLRTGLQAEYLGILTDAACTATGPARHGAVQLLQRDFALDAQTDAAALSAVLVRAVRDLPADAMTEPTAALLATACQRLAAALALQADAASGEKTVP